MSETVNRVEVERDDSDMSLMALMRAMYAADECLLIIDDQGREEAVVMPIWVYQAMAKGEGDAEKASIREKIAKVRAEREKRQQAAIDRVNGERLDMDGKALPK